MTMERNKAIIYCRTASGSAEEVARSLAAQEARCTLFAREKGYQVIGRFSDQGSGTDRSRAGLRSMMNMVAQTEGALVVVDARKVLARDPATYLSTVREVVDLGGRVIDREGCTSPQEIIPVASAISFTVQS